MKILFAVSECTPFVKSGGLADVAGALPKALAELGNEVAVMLPKYSQIPELWKKRMKKGRVYGCRRLASAILRN